MKEIVFQLRNYLIQLLNMNKILFQLIDIINPGCQRLFSQMKTTYRAVFALAYKGKTLKKGLGEKAGRGRLLSQGFGVFQNTPSPKRQKYSNLGFVRCQNVKFVSKPKLFVAPAAKAIRTFQKFRYVKCLSHRALNTLQKYLYVKMLMPQAIKTLEKFQYFKT